MQGNGTFSSVRQLTQSLHKSTETCTRWWSRVCLVYITTLVIATFRTRLLTLRWHHQQHVSLSDPNEKDVNRMKNIESSKWDIRGIVGTHCWCSWEWQLWHFQFSRRVLSFPFHSFSPHTFPQISSAMIRSCRGQRWFDLFRSSSSTRKGGV